MRPFLLVIFFYFLPIHSFSDEIMELPDEVELETESEFDVIDLSSQNSPESFSLDGSFNTFKSKFNKVNPSLTFGSYFSNISDVSNQNYKTHLNLKSNFDLGEFGFLDFSGRLKHETKKNIFEYDVNLLQIQNSSGPINWVFGKNRITWGDVEGSTALDVLNISNSILEQELPNSDRMGRWFAQSTYFTNETTTSFFISLSPDVIHSKAHSGNHAEKEIGVSYGYNLKNGAMNLYAGKFLSRAGVVDISTNKSYSNNYKLLGISSHKTYRKLLFKMDLAAKTGLKRSNLNGLSNHKRIDIAFGFEYAINNLRNLLGKFETNHWLDNKDTFYIPGLSINLVQPNRSSSYSFNLSNKFNSDQIINNIFLAGDANRNNLLIGTDAIFKFNDYLEFKGSLLSFKANINDPSFILDDSIWLNIGLTKYF
jgi:hypothetical protein